MEMAKYNGNFGDVTVDGTTSCTNWYSVKLIYISIAGYIFNVNQCRILSINKSNRPATVILQIADRVEKGPWRHFLCSICLCLDDDLRDMFHTTVLLYNSDNPSSYCKHVHPMIRRKNHVPLTSSTIYIVEIGAHT